MFGWVTDYRALGDDYVLKHSSLDNFLYLRLFKIMAVICLVGCFITWPVLFPVNATGGGGQNGLDILSFSNVSDANRYYAHAIMAWVFLGAVMLIITRETLFYANLRQAYLLSPFETSQISSRTVIFVDVPKEAQNEEALRSKFTGVRYVWQVRDPGDLEDDIKERDKAALKLENGEIKLLTNALKRMKKSGKGDENSGDTTALLRQNKKDRPTHRTKFLIGKKVDTVDWSRGELHRLVPDVVRQQNDQRSNLTTAVSAVIIEFESVRLAQAAFYTVAKKSPFKAKPKDIGVPPDQVLWKNLKKKKMVRGLIHAASTAFITFLCIFWTIPVAFIGVLTNVNYLTNKLPWLSFINDIPPQILGLVTGLLPVILLAVLMALVPIICTLMAKQFEPSMGAVHLRVQNWYFGFQVIQVFLVTTFSSGAASVATQIIAKPASAPGLLAQNLPKASNFYISYFILFGLMQAALQLLNVVPLLFVMFLGKILDKTPRKMYNRYIALTGVGWGSTYPKFTNLGVIALSYSLIAPLLLGFATIGFTLLWAAWRYSAIFTLGTQVDTKGRAYAKALQQLTVGIYLSEVCLIGLLGIGSAGSLSSIGPLVITVVLLLVTIVWHVMLARKLKKRLESMADDEPADGGYNNLQSIEGAQPSNDGVYTNEPAIHRNSSDATKGNSETYPEYKVPPGDAAPAPPTGIVGKIKAFMQPHKYASAAVLSKHILSPHLGTPVGPYTTRERAEAYLNPALVSEAPIVWIARDKFGLSQHEVQSSQREIGSRPRLS